MEFFHTSVSAEAIDRATEVLASGWLSEGKVVKEFEDQLGRVLGVSHPVAVNSGTAALHLALAVCGVGPGDEVIVPAQTFVASGLVVLMQGAKVIFGDIDPRTGNLSCESVASKVSPRTKVIMPVDWAGYPCDLDEIVALAERHGATVVEDAAHALGATYRDRPIGSVSHITAFSFQAIKPLTTGDGGAVCALDPAKAEEARARRWFGIDRARSRPSILGEREYELATIGYKYHLNDLAAAVGLGNLEDFERRLARRRSIGGRYRAVFARVPGIELLAHASDRTHAYWLFTMLTERREDLIRALASRGVPASVVHLRIDRQPVFGGMADLPGQAEFDARQLSIPVHEGLSDEDVETVIEAIKAGW